jgi:hypothetical protein
MTGHVHEPHIVCPKCSHQIPLTESIAAPLLEAVVERFKDMRDDIDTVAATAAAEFICKFR